MEVITFEYSGADVVIPYRLESVRQTDAIFKWCPAFEMNRCCYDNLLSVCVCVLVCVWSGTASAVSMETQRIDGILESNRHVKCNVNYSLGPEHSCCLVAQQSPANGYQPQRTGFKSSNGAVMYVFKLNNEVGIELVLWLKCIFNADFNYNF